MPPKAARFGDLPLIVTSFRDEGGRDWNTQSPARGDDHIVQDRGKRQQRTTVELIFCRQPGAPDYMAWWFAFRALADLDRATLFTHPMNGTYLSVVADLTSSVDAQRACVTASCVFVPAERSRSVFPLGAGVTAVAGPEQVGVLAGQADAQLAAAGLTSSAPGACTAQVTAWSEAEDPDARTIALQAAGLAGQIDAEVERLQLLTEIGAWQSYRSMVILRDSVARAAAAATSETAQVMRLTLSVAEPLRSLCARLYGASEAEDRARQVMRLNGLRTPGMVPAGTVLSLPTVSR